MKKEKVRSQKGPHSQRKNEGRFFGKVFSKKANMWLEYVCFNTKDKTDKVIWL